MFYTLSRKTPSVSEVWKRQHQPPPARRRISPKPDIFCLVIRSYEIKGYDSYQINA